MIKPSTYSLHTPFRSGFDLSVTKLFNSRDLKWRPIRFSLLLTLAYCILIFLSGIVLARDKYDNILILLSDNKDVYLDVATTITNSTIKYCRNHGLSCANSNYDIVHVSSYDNQAQKDYKLIITLGIHAALFSQNNTQEHKIISALIPKSNLLIKKTIHNSENQHFLYLDQPLFNSLALIKSLSNRFNNIGVLVDSKDMDSIDSLNSASKKLDLNIFIESISSTELVGKALNNLLDKIDIFLATPDTNIHNKSTVSNILLSTYRKGIPMIGFSSAYVKAGALAAVYSSPENIAHQVRDSIIAYFSNQQIPKEQQMSSYYSVLFNTDVARSLGFPIKSESKLKAQMMDFIENDSK
jgi:putative tryptophan/tyrosine transport system substrate-binding protein